MMSIQQTIDKLLLNPRQLFLIDGLGAIISAVLLGVVLVQFRNLVGMPESILYILAIIPCFFAGYSLFCYYRMPNKWPLFLKIIAVANTLYCCISIVLILYYYQQISYLGILYFLLEVIIVMLLVSIEWKAASQKISLKKEII